MVGCKLGVTRACSSTLRDAPEQLPVARTRARDAARGSPPAKSEGFAQDRPASLIVDGELGWLLGSGFLPRTGYSGVDHWAPSLWSGPRGAATPPRPSPYLTAVFSHNYLSFVK